MGKKLMGLVLASATMILTSTTIYANKALFESKCASCHGKDGKGNPAMAKTFKVDIAALDLTDKASLDKKDADLSTIVSKGLNKMPAHEKKLKADEIISVVSYFRSLASGSTATASSPATSSDGDGAKLFVSKCASCHGKDGKGNPAMAKTFKVDTAALDLVDEATLAKNDKDLTNVVVKGLNKMPAYNGKLKAEEVASIITYIKSLKK